MSDPEFDYLGPYRVEKTLGRGGMGTVYLGVHAKTSEVVAIKVIAAGVANQVRFRRRFEAEIRTLQKLKHPNIVSLQGVGEERGLLFYTMEYVDGQSLHDHLRHHTRLPWEDVVEVGVQVTAALKHAHDLGIIHRDLKPANLMLNSDGVIKLTDFGIAKLFGSADMTAAGAVIGTADYMPPEQAEGKGVTAKSDLYGLGSVLYALLCGKPPFTGKSVPEVLYAVRYNPVPSIDQRVEDVPQALSELIHDLLEKSPSKRPPTTLVVRNRLLSIQKGMERIVESGEHPKSKTSLGTGGTVATQLTSLDLSDVDDEELKMTDVSDQNEHSETPLSADESIRDGNDTHEQKTMLAPRDGLPFEPGDQTPTAFAGSGVSDELPLSGTENPLSDEDAIVTGDKPSEEKLSEAKSETSVGPLTSGGPSHYTPASEYSEPEYERTPVAAAAEPSSLLQYASIAGIVAVLLGSISFAWWMLQPKGVDELYADIVAAVDSGDDGRFLLARDQVEEFLTRFPSDERAVEVEGLRDEIELSRWTRILRRRATRSGTEKRLTAMEQAFLDCIDSREKNEPDTESKLNAFLALFESKEELSSSERNLVDLAQYARNNLQRVERKANPALEELESLISDAEANREGEGLKDFYNEILLLYSDKEWAAEQIQRIRKKLETEF
ncbi:MAG: serine/threonine protein kinase [Aureliella sp.]